jgi:hypothetical protein
MAKMDVPGTFRSANMEFPNLRLGGRELVEFDR